MNERYNGWTNYETWNVALWLDNDQGSSEYWNETAQEYYDNAEAERSFTRKERAALDLADRLKSEIEEANPLGSEASMFSDLMSAALGEVDWYEIAGHYLDEVEEETEAAEDESSQAESASDAP